MEYLEPQEIRERYGHLPYITPYERILALVDDTLETVELHEFHARGVCIGGAAWEVYHYPGTSPLVIKGRREGARNIFTCRTGRAELTLKPGLASAGLEEVRVTADEVTLTYAGLAGGGIAATLCRGMADNVIGTTVHETGGGSGLGRATLRVPAWRKTVIGVDDTDNAERGATWSTMNEIAFELSSEGFCEYLGHVIVQLFPDNPHKTTNCCSTAIVLGTAADVSRGLAGRVREMLAERCYSPECGMAVSVRIAVDEELRRFAGEAKTRMVTLEEARRAADGADVVLEAVTGSRGCIGALAAVGMHDEPDKAVVPFGSGGGDDAP